MLYKKIIRPLLFLFEAEAAHTIVFASLKIIFFIPGVRRLVSFLFSVRHKSLEKNIAGLMFKNPVGLAAGFDKDGKMAEELSAFGFGFIEIGTVTPLPQPGNKPPRLFRLPQDGALINRMGFNNEGVLAAAQRLKKLNSSIIIGGNIGKNKDTPNEKAADDYLSCFHALFDVVDYFVVNVSSPNTPGLRDLQNKAALKEILDALNAANNLQQYPKAVFVKIAPDLSFAELDEIIALVKQTGISGIIAVNTSTGRNNLKTPQNIINKTGAGGISGKPLAMQSTEIIRYIAQRSNKEFFIIGTGGIMTAEDAIEKLNAGADIIQLYTGFIYEGPGLIKKINKIIVKEKRNAAGS